MLYWIFFLKILILADFWSELETFNSQMSYNAQLIRGKHLNHPTLIYSWIEIDDEEIKKHFVPYQYATFSYLLTNISNWIAGNE